MHEPAALIPDDLAPRDAAGRSLRHDGWTPERQRAFLEHIADGHVVGDAARLVGMSPSAAYAFRRRAAGAAFALGWRAAALVARDHLADTVLDRALNGVTDTYTRADGSTVQRHRHDNRLAMTLLRRLDAQAEDARPGDAAAARLVAGDFDAYLDLVGSDAGPARAGLFLAARAEGEDALEPLHALARADRFRRAGAGLPAEVEVADLDPAARHRWTSDQWLRAEAAGLVRLADAEQDAPACEVSPLVPAAEGAEPETPVWFDDLMNEWRTRFPPPDGFDGDEEGVYGDPGYTRTLTLEEETVMEAADAPDSEALAEAGAERDAWFAGIRCPAPETTLRVGRPDPAPVSAFATEAPPPLAATIDAAPVPEGLRPYTPPETLIRLCPHPMQAR